MILDVHNTSDAVDLILRQKVAQKVFDFFNKFLSGDKSSLTVAANSTTINIPLIATSDISRDTIWTLAKASEMKIALDIRKFLAININENPRDVSWDKLLKTMPVTILNKTATHSGNGMIDFVRGLGVSVVDEGKIMISESDKLSLKIAMESRQYAKYEPTTMYSEAEGPIVQDRIGAPTQLEVEIKYLSKDDKIQTIKYYITVDCAPRYIDDIELMTRLSTFDNRRFFSRFVQLEKGEINFLSEWALDLKELAVKAKTAAQGSKNLMNMVDKFNMLQDMGVNVYPFLTMLVSKDFIEKLYRDEKMDFKKSVDHIIKKFFCLGVYIYDSNTDLVEVYYDGDPDFKSIRIDDISNETKRYERELKQLIKFNK